MIETAAAATEANATLHHGVGSTHTHTYARMHRVFVVCADIPLPTTASPTPTDPNRARTASINHCGPGPSHRCNLYGPRGIRPRRIGRGHGDRGLIMGGARPRTALTNTTTHHRWMVGVVNSPPRVSRGPRSTISFRRR